MLARTWLVCFCPCFSCRVFHSLWCTFFLSCCSVWQRPCYQYAFQVCITWMCWYFLKVIDVLRKKKEIHNGFSYWMLSLKTTVLIYKRRKFMVPTIPTLQLSEKLLSGKPISAERNFEANKWKQLIYWGSHYGNTTLT